MTRRGGRAGLPAAEPGPPGDTQTVGVPSTQRRIRPLTPCWGALGTAAASGWGPFPVVGWRVKDGDRDGGGQPCRAMSGGQCQPPGPHRKEGKQPAAPGQHSSTAQGPFSWIPG